MQVLLTEPIGVAILEILSWIDPFGYSPSEIFLAFRFHPEAVKLFKNSGGYLDLPERFPFLIEVPLCYRLLILSAVECIPFSVVFRLLKLSTIFCQISN